MAADLTAIRALLASVQGFTPGPWHLVGFDALTADGENSLLALDVDGMAVVDRMEDARFIAAAPTLHAHLTAAIDEIERLRAEVEARIADAVAAERMAIGEWVRNLPRWSGDLARSIEHGDHIDDDAPPLPSLRMVLLLRDELLRQVETLTAERDHWRSVAQGRCERIDELHAEIDKLMPPHCQHAGDSGHDIGHGVHPDRGGPSVLEREIERLTAERDRRIEPVEHARAVFALFLLWARTGYGQNEPSQSARRRVLAEWLASTERAALLARVGREVLAEVER